MAAKHPGAIHPPPSGSSTLPHLLNGLVLIGLFIYSLATYHDLPGRIPIHFDGSGNPNGWTDTGWGSWLALPFTALGLTLLMYASARLVDWARKNPRLMSLPYKEKFLALPEEKQAPIWRKMKGLLYWLCFPVNLLILYAQVSIHTTATSDDHLMAVWPLFVLIGAIVIITIVMTIDLFRSVKRAVEKP